jgi:MFS family permease
MSVGAFCAMVAAPIWGPFRPDNSQHRPAQFWILTGSLLLLLGLVTMAFSRSIWLFGAGWLICQIGSNAAQAALNAVLPDQVPLEQRGRMSSFLGLTTVFAMVSGTFITQFTHHSAAAMFLVPWLPYLMAVLLMLRFLPDAPAPTSGTRALATVLSAFSIAPFRNRDFSLAFACRFLLTTGNSFAQTYQVFVLMDVIGLASGQVPSAMFTTTACVAVMGAILSPLAGTLVDKTGRMKPLVVVAGALVIAGLLAVSQTKTLKPFITAMVVLGVGKALSTP